MIRLSDHVPKLLMPVPKAQWRTPSAAQQKDQFGNENQTRFRITGRLHDGHPKFRLWFDDRDDADAFMWSLIRYAIEGVPFPREYWGLVDEVWGDPTLTPWMYYAVDTVQFIVSTSASNQTWTSPADWDSAHNTIEVVAGGGAGGGATGSSSARHCTGGGGGGYSSISGFVVATPGTTTATFSLNAAATKTRSGNSATIGTGGSNVWFDGATLAASSVGAVRGAAGDFSTGSVNGGTGGTTGTAIGTVLKAGGRGGNLTGASGDGGSGGGGAGGMGVAGAGAVGNNGSDSSATTSALVTTGGSGDGGSGGSGTAGSTSADTTGGSGTEWDGSHGSGGGAGGIAATTARTSTGGAYGAGSGGISTSNTGSSTTTAGQGIIVITYTPAVVGGVTYTQLERSIRGYLRGVTPGTLH